MSAQRLSDLFSSAQEHEQAQPQVAICKLRDVVLGDFPNDAESIKTKEQALQSLANLYAKQKNAEALRALLTDLRPLFALIPKAKTAKIVRTVVDTIAKVPDSTAVQVKPRQLLPAGFQQGFYNPTHPLFFCIADRSM